MLRHGMASRRRAKPDMAAAAAAAAEVEELGSPEMREEGEARRLARGRRH
jgi:hypothetical protein